MLVAALLTIPAIAIEQSDAGATWDTLATTLNWGSGWRYSPKQS